MKTLFTILLSCTFFTLPAQRDIQFFTTGELYSGITKEANFNSILASQFTLVDIAFVSMPQYINTKSQFVMGINLQAGVILEKKWYMSMGLRYDARRSESQAICPECSSVNSNYQVTSQALDIPISFRYRVISDLPISPILHAETFLSFRQNVESNRFYAQSQQTKYNKFGYRLGVGLNYQLGSTTEINLIGSWGKAKSFGSGGNFFSHRSNNYTNTRGYIKDYQLALGVLRKISS